jgi:hypothetical protein
MVTVIPSWLQPPFGRGEAMTDRPPLVWQQGSWFRWAAPAGWHANETQNGVDLVAPDGITAAGSQLLRGAPGSTTPKDFVVQMLGLVPGYAGLQLLAVHPLPDQRAGTWRGAWKIAEVELAGAYRGVPFRGAWTCGISGMWGMSYDALLQGYQAPAAQFEAARLWLCRIASCITVANLRGLAGNDQVIQPRNNPLDNSGLLESWRQKGLSEARISQARREGTMGYERMKDAATGHIYEMPFEAYDGTVGGYRNPLRPTELLQKAQPGE